MTLWNTATCSKEQRIYFSPGTGSPRVVLTGWPPLRSDPRQGPKSISVGPRRAQRLFRFPGKYIQDVHFAAGGIVVVVLNDGHLLWWDPVYGQSRSRSFSRPDRLRGHVFRNDGRLIASVDPQTWKILLWSTETLELIRELPGHGVACGELPSRRIKRRWPPPAMTEWSSSGMSSPVKSC